MPPDKSNGPCGMCGRPDNVGLGGAPWFAPNVLWNHVYGTPDNPRGDGVLRCPGCFTADARHAGAPVIWTAASNALSEDDR